MNILVLNVDLFCLYAVLFCKVEACLPRSNFHLQYMKKKLVLVLEEAFVKIKLFHANM